MLLQKLTPSSRAKKVSLNLNLSALQSPIRDANEGLAGECSIGVWCEEKRTQMGGHRFEDLKSTL